MCHLTIFALENDRYSARYSWDISDIDKQGIENIHKLDVPNEVIERIKNCTLERLEVLLKSLI